MVLDFIIGVVVGLLNGVLALIPDFTIGSRGIGSSIGSAAAGANSVFPVVTLGLCIAAVIGLRLFLAVVAFLAWVWDKIPLKMS